MAARRPPSRWVVGQRSRYLDRQPGLTRAAGTGNRDQPVPADQLVQFGQLRLPPPKAHHRSGHGASRRGPLPGTVSSPQPGLRDRQACGLRPVPAPRPCSDGRKFPSMRACECPDLRALPQHSASKAAAAVLADPG